MDEYGITEYVLNHKDGIIEDIKIIATQAKDNPILKSYFQDAVVNEVILAVAEGMNINYIDVALVIDKSYLLDLFGNEFFNI